MNKKPLTPYQKVEKIIVGLSNEQAEEVAAKILAQIIAKHIFVLKDGNEYMKSLQERLQAETMEYVKHNSLLLAVSRVVTERENKKDAADRN